MVIWFLSWKSARNTKTEVELDAWRRLNHKYDPRNPLRNIQLLERLLAPSKVGYSDVLQAWRDSGKSCEWFARDFAMMCRTSGNRHTWCASRKICPKILRDHFGVQAPSIDSLEKRRLTIEKFLQANVHGSQATPMDVDALAKTKGGKGKDKGGKSKKFEGNCFWCGAYGHMMEDCQEKAAGKPQVPKSRRGPDRKPKGKGKGGKDKKGASSLDEWQDCQENPPSDEKVIEEVAGLFVGPVSRHERYIQRDWQAWERIQKQARDQWNSYKSGNLGANAVDAELGERIDLTIDSGCAACALPVGVASAVGLQQLNRTPQGYIAANAQKFRELGFKDSDTQISEW